ncbi:MAG: L,D-transpeptidase family protein [Woeseiaceae bacterium]|nr:L,D-transpeptidase family protein [Woeseiaceae bacterium]
MLRYILIGGLLLPAVALAGGQPELPPFVLELPAAVQSVLVAEAERSTLHLYTREGPRFRRAAGFYMSIGENGIGKERAWDRRTPLGVYFITDRLDPAQTPLHERYGVLALPLDYPNALDRRRGRSGDGIWIHGVLPADGRRPPLDTDGCLALANEDLVTVDGAVELLSTPVLVARSIATASPGSAAALRKALRSALDSWADSFRRGAWPAYLAAYADDFRYRGLDRDEYAAYRVRAAATRPVRDYSIDEVFLLADPEQENIYLARFRQVITGPDGPVVTTKRLYWRREADGAFRIVAEDNG